MPVRTTRARIIHLRNDYKELMSKVEKHLHEHFASLMEQNGDDNNEPAAAAPSSQANPALRDYVPEALDDPFAKVNTVAPNSPAATAGLQPGDLIRNFGWVNKSNHDGLKKVAECVQGNEGVSENPWLVPDKAAANCSADYDVLPAERSCQGIESLGRPLAAGAPVDLGPATRLGRAGSPGMPHSASMSLRLPLISDSQPRSK